MPEPEEIRFACIGCGALNPVGAEACSGCGHRFAGPDVVSTPPMSVPPERRPLTPDRYFEPPKAEIAPPPRFRIGTAMAFIAVIAVCLAGFAADVSLGILTSLALGSASIRTFLVSARHEARGRPMDLSEQFLVFLMTMMGTVLVVISSAIGFCVTCFPVGIGSSSLPLALAVGGAAAIATAFWVARGLLRIGRKNEVERDQIRWY